jgi:hypothetical protein
MGLLLGVGSAGITRIVVPIGSPTVAFFLEDRL